MQFQKRVIQLADLPAVFQQFQQACKAGDAVMENLRCYFTIQDDPVEYLLPVFDWLDSKIPLEKITRFVVYQILNS